MLLQASVHGILHPFQAGIGTVYHYHRDIGLGLAEENTDVGELFGGGMIRVHAAALNELLLHELGGIPLISVGNHLEVAIILHLLCQSKHLVIHLLNIRHKGCNKVDDLCLRADEGVSSQIPVAHPQVGAHGCQAHEAGKVGAQAGRVAALRGLHIENISGRLRGLGLGIAGNQQGVNSLLCAPLQRFGNPLRAAAEADGHQQHFLGTETFINLFIGIESAEIHNIRRIQIP